MRDLAEFAPICDWVKDLPWPCLHLLLKKEKMYAYVYEGKRHDTGDRLGFLKATVEFALKRPDLGEALRQYLKSLKL